MKKILCALITTSLFFLLAGTVLANAATILEFSDEEKYEYTINTETNTVTITGSKTYVIKEDPIYGNTVAYCVGGDVTIPSELEGYPVTELADSAFNGCSINKLIIPEGIEIIGDLSGCPTEVYIPASATQIDSGAFGGINLEKLTVAEGNPIYHSVQNCLVETETKTLMQTTKDGIIPDDGSVTKIASELFNGIHVETLVIPDAITDIDYYAFFGCSCDNLYIGKGYTKTNGYYNRFYNIRVEKSITISEENPVYHSQSNCWIETETKTLVAGCNNSIIPDDGSVKTIGPYAFGNCNGIKDLVIPNGVKVVREYAFQGCSNLEYIAFPESVESIGLGAFECCSNLSEIVVDRDNLVYHSIANCLIHTANKTLIFGNKYSVIPSDGSVETIGYEAFYGLSNMYYLNIPEGVKTIGDSAFCGTSLFMVSLPSTLQTIDSYNFNNSTLKHILYNGSEEDRANITIQESWPGQNSGLNSAQWYYNGERPFPEITVSAESVECTRLIDGSNWYTGGPGSTITHKWFEYDIAPQITVHYPDGETFTGRAEEIEAKFGFPVKIYDNQSSTNQWELGVHSAKLCFLDQTVQIKVTVVDHPIEKIEIQDVTIIEQTNGYESDNGYKYSFSPQYTVIFKDGSVLQVDNGQDIEVAGKRIQIDTNIYSMQQQDPWVAGQSYTVRGTLLDIFDDFTITVKEKSLQMIAVTAKPAKLVYTAGEALDTSGMMITAYYDNKTIERITDYQVSGYDPATVGKQTVTVSYGDVQTSFEVKVLPINVTGIVLNQQEIPLITGNTAALIPTVSPADATNKSVIWTSSNPAVANVDEHGNVIAFREGAATITATTQDGGFYANCMVYVVCNHVTLIYQEAKEPDCVNDGYTAHYTCNTCDSVYKEDKRTETTLEEETLSALGHSFTNYISNNDATHHTDGTKSALCDRAGCGAIDTIADPGSKLQQLNGWVYETHQWYYYRNGVKQIGWLQLGSTWYYLDANGAMKTGWLQLGNTWYYLDANGAMKTGWLQLGSTWYYLDANGTMKTGWLQLGSTWYYLDANGAMKTGWLYDGGLWYYMNTSGAMVTGWLYDGVWYYMNTSGAMHTGWLYDSGVWYYMNISGVMVTRWQYIDYVWYLFDDSGVWIS